MWGHCRRRLEQEDGVGLVLVIGFITIISALIVVAGTVAITALTSSRQRVTYEQALATAESGIDMALARLQKAFDDYNADYPIPSMPSAAVPAPECEAAPVPDPAPFASDAAEKAWAKSQLDALLSAHPECVRQGPEGEYLVFKPQTPLVSGLYPKNGKIYALGWSPNRTDPNRKTRLLKAEYLFMPYRPTHAVLSGGDLALSSSTKVTSAFGVDPTEASVHTNGSLSSVGNPTVTGMVTSTGASGASSTNFNPSLNPGGNVQSLTTQRVPKVGALSFYMRALSDHPEYDSTWYDLCPDGTTRTRAASGPCTSATILNSGSPTFRGWEYTSATRTWVASKDTQDGIYYVHEGNIDVGPGNGEIDNITLIASAQNADNCSSKKYGNIAWDHFGLLNPAYVNLWMYADSDITTHSNFFAGSGTTSLPVVSGMFVAGDQMHMETSSQGAVGSVVVGDQCTTGSPDLVTTSEIKNPEIYYDPNSDAPFTSIITTILWLEYVG